MESIANFIRLPRVRAVSLAAVALLAIVCFSLVQSGCTHSPNRPPAATGIPIVRVLLLDNRQIVQLSATDPPTVRSGTGPAQRLGFTPGVKVGVARSATGWNVGDVEFGPGELIIEPAVDGSVSIDGNAFRGKYRLVPKAIGHFDVINDIDVESYLMGVLAKELYANWHEEAYRAQAVTARTYAIFRARTTLPGANYDLFADVRSQMYTGISGETAKSRKAVQDTRGLVVAYGPQGDVRIFNAYYSSCCGGVSQNAESAFGEPPSEPLSERNVGTCCAASPKYTWPTVTVSKTEFTRRLRIWGTNNKSPVQNVAEVNRVEIFASNHLGRPTSFIVTDARGYRYRLGCEDLRTAVNTDATDGAKLPSSFCKPISENGVIKFTEGRGLGHGVGLCQWCAQGQALAGMPYDQIVLKAFPKAVIVQAY